MKKIYTTTLLAVFLFTGITWAGDGFLYNSALGKKLEIKKPASRTSKKLFGKGDDAFAQGKIIFSAGYGFPNLGKSVLTALVSDSAINVKVTGVGPLHFRMEYAISDGVGLGVSVNYISCGVNYTELPYTYKFSRSSLSILARMNFHFGTTEKLDPYFGIGAGYKTATWKFSSNDPSYVGEKIPGFNPFGFETTIGVRYYFTPGFGIYGELGIAKSVMQGGLVVAL